MVVVRIEGSGWVKFERFSANIPSHARQILLLFIVEKIGDVLRYTSQWIMGLPSGDGLAATAAFTGGGPTWQCTMFDVMKAKNWAKVVEALTSNVDVSADPEDTVKCALEIVILIAVS
jgi:hypothetical protein